MIKVRSFFPPKKRDQAILTEPYFNNHKPLYRPFKHKNSESLFSLKKFNHHKKCFYEKKNIDFKKIKDKEDDQAKALEAKVLKVHIS